MSCCPSSPPQLGSITGAFVPYGPASDIERGENPECYAKNASDPTGLMDDATEDVPNSIQNVSVTPKANGTVNEVFKLTPNSSKTAQTWEVSGSPSFSFSGNILTGTLSKGQKYKILVTAKDQDGVVIDEKSYVFAYAEVTPNNSIKLVSPLPGAIVNSKFGPRLHPIKKVMKPHRGIDMKYADRSVGDVVAAADGEVIFSGNSNTGYGIRVLVKHFTGNGSHLCTTTYSHLAKVYVGVGQKVSAGQKLGLEGTTGASTGNHLHFELVLPNGTFIDPVPYINGNVKVATATKPNGDAEDTNDVTNDSSLTKENVDAKEGNTCAPGENYSTAQQASGTPPSLPEGDAFERAWFNTMKHEVGPFWDLSYPSKPNVIQGLIDTKANRRDVGYVNVQNDYGGVTKFGVSQRANRSVVVDEITYAQAKSIGYEKYWLPIAAGISSPKLQIMLFDMTYLHGAAGARRILNTSAANPNASNQDVECAKLRDAQIAYFKGIVESRPNQQKFLKGWTKRANDLYNFAISFEA